MKDRRYINYRINCFKQWKNKVCKYIPNIVQEFYKIEDYIPYEIHCLLGKVILGLNNPAYAILDYDGRRLDAENEMAMEIILELQVNELFSFVYKHKRKLLGTIPLPNDFVYLQNLKIIKSDGTIEDIK